MSKLLQLIADGIREDIEQDKKREAEQLARTLAESAQFYRQPPAAPPPALNPTNAPAELYCRHIPTLDERYIPIISPRPAPTPKRRKPNALPPTPTPTLAIDQPAPHGYYIITITDRLLSNIDPDTLPIAAKARRPQHTPAPAILYYDGNNKINSAYYEGYLRIITRLKKLNFQYVNEHDEKTYLTKKSNKNKFRAKIEREKRRNESRKK